MANYCCAVRTNYFHVKDEKAFEDMFTHVLGNEDSVDLWKENGDDGSVLYGFGCYGTILGYVEDPEADDAYDDEDAYDNFILQLQKHVADDDAIIIMESGNEKLRYVCGTAFVITSKETKYIDMTRIAIEEAQHILKNKEWTTRCEY